jgi:hypothetical protein
MHPNVSVRPPIIAGAPLDSKGWWSEQLFYYVKIGGFLLLPLERCKCNTGRIPITPEATPATNGNRREKKRSTNIKQGNSEKQILLGQTGKKRINCRLHRRH